MSQPGHRPGRACAPRRRNARRPSRLERRKASRLVLAGPPGDRWPLTDDSDLLTGLRVRQSRCCFLSLGSRPGAYRALPSAGSQSAASPGWRRDLSDAHLPVPWRHRRAQNASSSRLSRRSFLLLAITRTPRPGSSRSDQPLGVTEQTSERADGPTRDPCATPGLAAAISSLGARSAERRLAMSACSFSTSARMRPLTGCVPIKGLIWTLIRPSSPSSDDALIGRRFRPSSRPARPP